MDLNGIDVFLRVIKAASFSRAAKELGITKSTASKKVSDLEKELNTTLIRRTTRSLHLTEAGKRFYEQCARALSEINNATTHIKAASSEPSGLLRITAPADFATNVMAPFFAGFLKEYSKVTLELVLTDRVLDLVNDEIDLAIRLGRMSDSALKSKKIGRHRYQLVASPDYLKGKPALKRPEDLKNHFCLSFIPDSDHLIWELRSGNLRANIRPHSRFLANSVSAVKMLALAGAGIALLPIPNCADEIKAQKLRVVLPEWSMEDAPVQFVYQNHHFQPLKLKAFIDYMEEKLKPLLL